MALTKTDLLQMRKVIDESIAEHPRFNEMKAEIITEVTDQVAEVIDEALGLIDKRFTSIESRLDNLRIVSH